MKRVVSLAFTAAILVICGAVKGGDVEDCRNAEALLKADSSRVVSECRRLADQGDALAQFSLGFMYDNGYGVPQDYAEAISGTVRPPSRKTPRPSTTWPHVQVGYGVQRDYDEAMRWFRRAADQGDAGAQYNLAFMYATGRGVRKDLVQAYMWFDLAGRSAYPRTPRLRDPVSRQRRQQDDPGPDCKGEKAGSRLEAKAFAVTWVLPAANDLTRLMIRYNVGCRIEETLHLKKVDEDFFCGLTPTSAARW